MANSIHSISFNKKNQLALDFVVSLLFVLAICLFLEPRWDTNDDISMSMVAHGYGFAATGSPNLVFSNIIWGYLVRALPQINGILGYSIATYAVLVSVGTVILYALRQYGFGWWVSLFAMALILVRSVLFPQFTINAGLLTVAAIVCWHLYGQQNNRLALPMACLLAFCGYLVRNHEFLLILLIALPLLPWEKLAKDRTAKIYILFLILAIGMATFLDHQAYQGSDWQAFRELDPARVPFTDFGAVTSLKAHPEILARYGYSTNDLDLLQAWFFVDPKIADPAALNAMLAELGPLAAQNDALANGWKGIQTLMHPVLLPGFLAAALLLLILPSQKLFLTWALAIIAIFTLGLLGRPGILRVYVPVLALLLIAPLIIPNTKHKKQHHYLPRSLVAGTLIVGALFNTITTFSDARASQIFTGHVQRGMHGFPNQTIVIWSAFSYEHVYPVLSQPASIMDYRLYSLGTDTLAPFSKAYLEEQADNGMLKRLFSEVGVPIIAEQHHFNFLAIYCQEHFEGTLQELASNQYGHHNISWRRCQTQKAQ